MTSVNVLLVDGYNVIHQTPPYSAMAAVDLEAARLALVSDVAAFAHGAYRATVVFDGHNNPQSSGLPHRVAGITVIFSRFGMEADAVIESLARASRAQGEPAIVVTSDAQTQWTVLGGSVKRMSSAEFARELRSESDVWRDHAPAGSIKGRLADRINAETRGRLSRWARGLP